MSQSTNSSKTTGPRNGAKRPPWQDNRVLMAVSLGLSIIVWVVFASVNSNMEEHTIQNVRVDIDLSGTTAEELDLKPFFPSPTGQEEIFVDVVVMAPRYDVPAPEDLDAKLKVDSVNRADDYSLAVQVSRAQSSNKSRFEIKDYYVGKVKDRKLVNVAFDYERTLPFELIPVVEGNVDVPEGFYKGDLMLSKKFVSITGPQQKLAKIAAVTAKIVVDQPLKDTMEFENIEITPLDAAGNAIPHYLTVEGDVSATLPIWELATLRPMVDFLGAPESYYATPLRYTITPNTVQAALPSASIAANQSCSVGAIDFAALSPGHNTKTFSASDLKQVAFLDGTEKFTVWVDMSGLEARAMTLPAANIKLAEPAKPDANTAAFTAQFRNDVQVTVVGTPEALDELTAENLQGEAVWNSDTPAGQTVLDMRVRVVEPTADGKADPHPSCWIYGAYTVAANLTKA